MYFGCYVAAISHGGENLIEKKDFNASDTTTTKEKKKPTKFCCFFCIFLIKKIVNVFCSLIHNNQYIIIHLFGCNISFFFVVEFLLLLFLVLWIRMRFGRARLHIKFVTIKTVDLFVTVKISNSLSYLYCCLNKFMKFTFVSLCKKESVCVCMYVVVFHLAFCIIFCFVLNNSTIFCCCCSCQLYLNSNYFKLYAHF